MPLHVVSYSGSWRPIHARKTLLVEIISSPAGPKRDESTWVMYIGRDIGLP